MTNSSFFDWELNFRKRAYKNKVGLTESEFASFMKNWRKEKMPLKILNVFDIDGTICESFFPNLGEVADIEQLKARILETPLFQDFVEYHETITRNKNIYNYFITGRRVKDFGKETFLQLKPLGPDLRIIFYPDTYNHSKIRYSTFKMYHILKIARAVPGAISKINVFDDLDQYFPRLVDIASKLGFSNIEVHLVQEPVKFWKSKLKKEVTFKK